MPTNRYANSGEKFGEKFQPGQHAMTAVYQFLTELTTGKNGFDRDPAFAPELHIDDADERRKAVIRKLNSAGQEGNFRIIDQKDGHIQVQTYNEYALDEASPIERLQKLERFAKATDKKSKALEGLDGLSEEDADKAAIRKESLDKLVQEAESAVQASREFNFVTMAKHLGLSDETARKLLPHMDELMGSSKKKR